MDYLSLCLICKDENDYLAEWLDYHILMGVDRFYIYDNESRVSLRVTLRPYIEKGWAIVVDIAGKGVQLYAYDHCLQVFGAQTRWLGFIDTDEFLVPKTTLDLKDFLKAYEDQAGLAISSLFFGSGGHKTRPAGGQIFAYRRRTPANYSTNTLVKCIVQPAQVEAPNSPHDFLFRYQNGCVNEGYLRVDDQRFPNKIEKIQLNHYYCRSEEEIRQKLGRGRGDRGETWARARYDGVNAWSNVQDTTILDQLNALFKKLRTDPAYSVERFEQAPLLEKMAGLARLFAPTPVNFTAPREAVLRNEVTVWIQMCDQVNRAVGNGDYQEARRLTLILLEALPFKISLLKDLAVCNIHLKDFPAAWQALSQAWKLAPNAHMVLAGMAFYFLEVANFDMAEKTSRLLLEIDAQSLLVLGFLTRALIGLGKNEEALQIGIPLIERNHVERQISEDTDIFNLTKQLSAILVQKKDFAAATRLWEASAKFRPTDLPTRLEWIRSLILMGEKGRARHLLIQARKQDPQNPTILELLKQLDRPL